MSVLVRRTIGERRAYLEGAISAYAYVAARDETPAPLKAQLRAMIDLTEKSKSEPPSDDEEVAAAEQRDRDFLAAAADKHEAERDAARRALAEMTAERDEVERQRAAAIMRNRQLIEAIDERVAERDAALAREQALRAALVVAKGAIDRDQTGLAAALNKIRAHVKGFGWLLESRGPYEWNDDRYRDEAGHAMRPTIEIAQAALAASGSLADKAFRAVEAALAVPTDDTALREFGLKVGRAYERLDVVTPEEAVDTVLRGGR